ncbi:MAG: hypothetical protein IJ318_02565 [Clostridia bacterium]|nr:hypothetical protein [Clostridia bacterium]
MQFNQEEKQQVNYKEIKKQVDFLLEDLYFVRIDSASDLANDTVPQGQYTNFAIVEFGTRTRVYDVITLETYPVVVKSFKNTLKRMGNQKCAYLSEPLARVLKRAGFKKCDPLLSKEDVIFIRSELAKYLMANPSASADDQASR